jgi:hypothetical protein
MVPLLFEHARVRQRLGDMGAELRKDLLVALAERAGFVAEQIERAQHALLMPERHHQLRIDARHEPEISRVLIDVVDEHGLLFGDRRADDAFADLQAEVQHHVERVTLGVRDLQHLPFMVEHVNGEHRERRQPGDEAGNAAQQLVDVEHRRHFASELEQRGNEFLIVRLCGSLGHQFQIHTRTRSGRGPTAEGLKPVYNTSPDGTSDAATRVRGD